MLHSKNYMKVWDMNTGDLLTTFNAFFLSKKTKEALIITARDMDAKERKRYGKK